MQIVCGYVPSKHEFMQASAIPLLALMTDDLFDRNIQKLYYVISETCTCTTMVVSLFVMNEVNCDMMSKFNI
jgi:hypothetical protein